MAPPPRRSRTVVVLAAVAGLVIGGAGVGLAWLLTSPSGGADASADADTACMVLDRATPPTVPLDDDKAHQDAWYTWVDRMSAASQLARAAADQDPGLKSFAEAFTKPVEDFQRNFQLTDEGRKAYDDAKALCDAR